MAKCCGQENYEEQRPKAERRLQLIQEIKNILGDIQQNDRGRGRARDAGRGGSGPSCPDLEEECRQHRKRRACTPPLITAIALHETRPTSDYSNMRHENSKQVTYVDATAADQGAPMPPAPWELPRTPSQELRAGTLYQTCECTKKNGLQHDCPRWDCGGRPECVAINPGPCCPPSIARKPVRGDRRQPSNLNLSKNERTRARDVDNEYMNYQEQLPEECTGVLSSTPQGCAVRSVELVRHPPHHLRKWPETNTSQNMRIQGPNMVCFCRPANQSPDQNTTQSKNEKTTRPQCAGMNYQRVGLEQHPRTNQAESPLSGVVGVVPQRAMQFVEMIPLVGQAKGPGVQQKSSQEVNVMCLSMPEPSSKQLAAGPQGRALPYELQWHSFDSFPQRNNPISFCTLNPSGNIQDQIQEFMMMTHSDALPVFRFPDPLPHGVLSPEGLVGGLSPAASYRPGMPRDNYETFISCLTSC